MHKKIALLIVALFLFTAMAALQHPNATADPSTGSISAVNSSSQLSPANVTTKVFANSTQVSSPVARALSGLDNNTSSNNTSSRYLYLPSKSTDVSYVNGHVQPSYVNSPAPMGIGDFGLRNSSGNVQGYQYSTTSFQGKISMNSSSAFYLENDAPHSFSMQLNSVLSNVTVSGSPDFTYWTQNVAFYSTRTHSLDFVSNIWNFTSANASMPNSTIAVSNGNQYYYPGVYIAIGPELNVSFPFTLSLYLNTSVMNNNDAVYFNYSLTYSNGTTVSGQYDMIEFNSANPIGQGTTTFPAEYSVNGNQTAPNGLLQDSEFVIGGPGGGSTSQFYGLNASMSLSYLYDKKYIPVPSAYNFGADTGETATGIAESYNQAHSVRLSAGPSMLYGMWNTTALGNVSSYSSGSVLYTGTIAPSNGFLFVSPGTNFSYSGAAWSPLALNGSYSFSLPPGSFTAMEMMSLHTPEVFSLSSGPVTMPENNAMGIYTPLVAMDNQQLANISSGGSGTASSPYVIFNSSYGVSINVLFSAMNDFTFPEFSGVLLYNISDHVILGGLSSFSVTYPEEYSILLYLFGLPNSNTLNMEIYNSSNISVENNVHITGWFSSILQGFPLANLVVWNSTNIRISGNLFDSLGSSILIYNSNNTYSNNTVTGNTFAIEDSSNYVFSSSLLYGYDDYGLELYSSNNTVYNNYFATILPVYSPAYDIYTGTNVTYQNVFTHSEAGTNIIGGSGISGNYWMNYIGFSTYNDYGLISGNGENNPITYSTGAAIQSSGIFSTTPWEVIVYTVVSINGTPSMLAGLEAVENVNAQYSLPNGAYDYVALPEGQYYETQGTFTVQNNFQTVYNQFISNYTYNVTFEAAGLPSGSSWYISLGGVGAYTTSQYVTYLDVPNGTYNFTAEVPGMNISPSIGLVTVSGSSEFISMTVTPRVYNMTFKESGLPSGTNWSITIGNVTANSTGGNIVFNVTNGNYSYSISSETGYISVPGGIVQISNSNYTVYVKFSESSPTPFPTNEVTLSVVVGLVIGSFVTYLFARRPRR